MSVRETGKRGQGELMSHELVIRFDLGFSGVLLGLPQPCLYLKKLQPSWGKRGHSSLR